jgi:hypothetical protein
MKTKLIAQKSLPFFEKSTYFNKFRLNNGPMIYTPLSKRSFMYYFEKAKILKGDYRDSLFRIDPSGKVTSRLSYWRYFDSGLKVLDEQGIPLLKTLASRRAKVHLSWGCGFGVDIKEAEKAAPHVTHIGLSDSLFAEWEQLPQNAHIIFDFCTHLKRYLKPGSIDVISSHQALYHLNDRGQSFVLSHLDLLAKLLVPKGPILTDILAQRFETYTDDELCMFGWNIGRTKKGGEILTFRGYPGIR